LWKTERRDATRSKWIEWKQFSSGKARQVALRCGGQFFFPILVFNDVFRGLQPGSIALALQDSPSGGVNAPTYSLPAALNSSLKRLRVEKLSSGQGFDLAVRDSNTGFTFFNIEGHNTITMPPPSRLPSPEAGF